MLGEPFGDNTNIRAVVSCCGGCFLDLIALKAREQVTQEREFEPHWSVLETGEFLGS